MQNSIRMLSAGIKYSVSDRICGVIY